MVDALLGEFESSKENGVDNAGTRHGDTEASVHSRVHELNLRSRRFVAYEAVALVDALCCVDGEDLCMSAFVAVH